MKRYIYTVAAALAATMSISSVAYAGVERIDYRVSSGTVAERQGEDITFESVTLDIQKQDGTEQLVLLEGNQGTAADAGEIDYSKVKVVTTLRNGRPAEEIKLLDTLKACLVGTDENVTYKWQGSMDGVNWSTIDGQTTNEYWVTYDNQYKSVRCVIKAGRLSFRGEAVELPTRFMAAPAWDEGNETHQMDESRENSNPDYIFRVNGKGFVMLDDYDNADAAFYVTTTEGYGDAANGTYVNKIGQPSSKGVSAHGIYTVANDGNSIGLMLKTLGNNYTFFGEDSNTTYALPGAMTEYISTDMSFPFWSSAWLKDRHFYNSPQKADIWMLAWDDFITYSDRLGYKDNLFDVGGEYYFLRDGSPIQGWYANCVVTAEGKSQCIKNGIGIIRPAFFLSDEFFKNVKLDDLASAGEGVLSAMRERYYIEDLSHLYPAKELEAKGFITRQEGEARAAVTTDIVPLDGVNAIMASISLRNDTDEIKAALAALTIYDKDGNLTAVKFVPVNAAARSITDVVCNIDGLSEITDEHKVSVVLLTV